MFRLATLLTFLGLAAATGIIIWGGYGSILEALRIAGWGIVWTSLYHVIAIVTSATGWRGLMPGKKRPSLPYFIYLLWLRGAVNNLMPVARIGGEVVAVRVMMKHGIRKSSAIAATVVELTLSVVAVFLFVLCGIFLFSLRIADGNLGWKLAGGLLASAPIIASLAVIQRIGFFGLLDKIFTLMLRETWKKFAGNAALLDRAIHTTYRRKNRVLACFLWVILSWCSGSGEVWLGLDFLGHRMALIDCFIIEALIQGASSVGFVIPGALGVQEAGFLFFGHLLGLPSDIAVALAVVRRCRDLILYLPGLILWQAQEGRWLLKKSAVP
jgi:glycosyltransferase 2 family protein